jgi:tRNA G18 (ribose-2'-O)-methylase SpoU
MKKLSHDEIAAHRFTEEALRTSPRSPIILLLDNVRSLYNVGSIFRSADGARIEKIYLCGYTPHPPRKELQKTALGALETVPWEYHESASTPLAELRQRRVTICALEHTDESISHADFPQAKFPVCLVVGNEITGISAHILEQAEMALEIPMYGSKQSLNVSVATAIALYELLRKSGPPR